jgi:hypothetical protein
LSGRCIGVRVNKSTDGRIVISGLEIIEPGLYFLVGAKRPFLTICGQLSLILILYLIIRKIMQNRKLGGQQGYSRIWNGEISFFKRIGGFLLKN